MIERGESEKGPQASPWRSNGDGGRQQEVAASARASDTPLPTSIGGRRPRRPWWAGPILSWAW